MKLKQLLFLLMLTAFACSKDDDVEHTADASLNNCFQIEDKYISNINSGGAYDLTDNFSDGYIFYSQDDDLLIKIDRDLNEIWRKAYAHLEGIDITIEGIIRNESGEILILSTDLMEYSDVAKVSSEGELIWVARFQGTNLPQFKSIVEGPDSSYILAGSVKGSTLSYQPAVTRINNEGDIIWSEIIDSPSPDIFKSATRSSDQYFLLGVNANSSDRDIFYHFIDEDGTYTERTDIGNEYGWIMKAISLSDKGFLTLSGSDLSQSGDLTNTQYQLIKINEAGGVVWTKLFGGDSRELSADVIEAQDGGYYILGNTTSFGFGGFDVFLIKTDASGNIIWQNTYGTSERDFAGTMIETDNGDLIIGGVTGKDEKLFIFKIDKDGNPK